MEAGWDRLTSISIFNTYSKPFQGYHCMFTTGTGMQDVLNLDGHPVADSVVASMSVGEGGPDARHALEIILQPAYVKDLVE